MVQQRSQRRSRVQFLSPEIEKISKGDARKELLPVVRRLKPEQRLTFNHPPPPKANKIGVIVVIIV